VASLRVWNHEIEGRRHYAAMLAAAIRKVAADPESPTVRARAELAPDLHSFHLQYARAGASKAKMRRPVHILYYRAAAAELNEIVRVLHERMDPGRHLRESPKAGSELKGSRLSIGQLSGVSLYRLLSVFCPL
jgi:toxin ParE1/3/4